MCGIFGILTNLKNHNIYKIIIDGLIQLQNRGYDSSGICVLNDKRFALVHNGIIENYIELKNLLSKNGYTFYSQTDTEIIVNLISYHYNELKNTFDAIHKTINDLHGTYGLIVINIDEPDVLYCVRNGSPLLIGNTEEYCIITSEQSGFCNMVNNYITKFNYESANSTVD